MSDRIKGFTVSFDADLTEEESNILATAILQMRHVISVDPLVVNVSDHIAHMRVRAVG